MDKTIQSIVEKNSKQSWWIESEKTVVNKYGKIFDLENLDQLSVEDFKSFLLIKNNLHWEGIHRQGNMVTSDMSELRKTLKFLLDESVSIEERLNQIFNSKSDFNIKGLGRAVITPILMIVYPEKYGVWNTRSEDALKKLKLFPKFNSKEKFGNRYLKINDILTSLRDEYSISLWQLDGIFGEISGIFSFGGGEENILSEEAKSQGISDAADFGMEKHLEDFLIANWDKTIFGKKYDLIYDDGNDLLSQQYRTDVGPIDILAISKDKKRYLVIELKKGRSSDAVVGQILRYINWIKKNLAKDKEVGGSIVVGDSDNKLQYSLYDQINIKLYIYKVDFKLKEDLLD